MDNDFTTPEQSKQLLGLGVPVNSADCYITYSLSHATIVNVLQNEKYLDLLDHISQFTIPCWSVGKLIKIVKKTINPTVILAGNIFLSDDIIESLINVLKESKK